MGDLVENREWYLAKYCPEGVPTSDHLKLRIVSLSLADDSIPDDHLAVETLLLSVDPYLRGAITGTLEGLFIPQYQLNQVYLLFELGLSLTKAVQNRPINLGQILYYLM